MDTFLVYRPAALREQPINASGSKTRTLTSQYAHLTQWARFIVRPIQLISLGVAWFTQNPARTTLPHSFWPQKRQRRFGTVRQQHSGLTSFPRQPPSESQYREPAQQPSSSAVRCLPPKRSAAWPSLPSCHHTSAAAIRFLFSHFWQRFQVVCKPRAPSSPHRVLYPLCAAWQRSDPLCDVSEAFQKAFPVVRRSRASNSLCAI